MRFIVFTKRMFFAMPVVNIWVLRIKIWSVWNYRHWFWGRQEMSDKSWNKGSMVQMDRHTPLCAIHHFYTRKETFCAVSWTCPRYTADERRQNKLGCTVHSFICPNAVKSWSSHVAVCSFFTVRLGAATLLLLPRALLSDSHLHQSDCVKARQGDGAAKRKNMRWRDLSWEYLSRQQGYMQVPSKTALKE